MCHKAIASPYHCMLVDDDTLDLSGRAAVRVLSDHRQTLNNRKPLRFAWRANQQTISANEINPLTRWRLDMRYPTMWPVWLWMLSPKGAVQRNGSARYSFNAKNIRKKCCNSTLMSSKWNVAVIVPYSPIHCYCYITCNRQRPPVNLPRIKYPTLIRNWAT